MTSGDILPRVEVHSINDDVVRVAQGGNRCAFRE